MILKLKIFLSKILFICGKKFKNKIYKLFLFAFFLSFLEFIGIGLFVSYIISIFGDQKYIFDFMPNISQLDSEKMMLIILAKY